MFLHYHCDLSLYRNISLDKSQAWTEVDAAPLRFYRTDKSAANSLLMNLPSVGKKMAFTALAKAGLRRKIILGRFIFDISVGFIPYGLGISGPCAI